MKNTNTSILLGTVFLLLTWLFVGVYRDDEFYEPYLFTKHIPTFKINFYSPIGMQDIELSSLTKNSKAEQIAFNEFVVKQHVQNNSTIILGCLPFILIQLTLSFFCFGILKFKRQITYKNWQLLIHFVICLITTVITLCLVLAIDHLYVSLFGGLLILTINHYTLLLLTKRRALK